VANASTTPSELKKPEQPRRALICSRNDTVPLDAQAVRRGCRDIGIATARQLCRDELHRFRPAAGQDGALVLGCTQEPPLFSEIAEGLDTTDVRYVNLRETAGWSTDGAEAPP
jgi:hypothetical protein